MQDTTKINTNLISSPKLVTDLNSSYLKEDSYSHARNISKNTHQGDLGTEGNEPSNTKCWSAPYPIHGLIQLPDDEVLVFSTDNTNSEIGIAHTKKCTYKTLSNIPCLGFNLNFPITGVAKKHFHKDTVVTFTDKNQPVRRLEVNKLSSITNCDDLLLFRKVSFPCLKTTKGTVGNIPNGMYSVTIAYVVDNQVFTNFISPTTRIPLYSTTNSNSITVEFKDLDRNFDQFAVVLVGNYVDPTTNKATKVAKQVGIYSTNVKQVSLSDFINDDYPTIQLSNLVVERKAWKTAGIISSNSNYLLLADLVQREEENYQPKALTIKAEYVVKQVPANYYELGGRDIGYYRDENYDLYIRGVYNTGEKTERFHIPGRAAESTDLAPASTADVYELDKQFSDCNPQEKIPKWQVENTAEKMIPYNNEFFCDERILGHGKMGYHQSTDLYPDNPAVYGDKANTPILLHRMPDESKVPRYSIIDGKEYINIIGIRLLEVPKFDSPDIIGYEVLRADRKGGNGTIIARGLMTNMRSFTSELTDQQIYYSNYPVNDLRPDSFISSTQTSYKSQQEQNFSPLSEYHLDKFTFYSPHTFFEPRYTLGNEIKIESEEIADIKGSFQPVFNHPQAKVLTRWSYWVAGSIGFIQSYLTLIGGVNLNVNSNAGEALGVNANTNSNVSSSTSYNINTIEDLLSFDLLGYITGLIVSMTGVRSAAANAGAVTKITNIITTALAILASAAVKIPYSVYKGIEQANSMIDIITKFTKFGDYTYQYNAHAIFKRSIPSQLGQKRRRLLSPATYLSDTLLSIEGTIVNNIDREKGVYLHLNKPIAAPITIDTSRQTIKEFGSCGNPTREALSTGSAFYATSKVLNPNQYGQIGSASPVITSDCIHLFTEEISNSPIIFGGDCIITRFSFQKKMKFFSQDLANTNYNPAADEAGTGFPYDYRKYPNIGYPRYWMDTTKYDFSDLLDLKPMGFSAFKRKFDYPANLDCAGDEKKKITKVDDVYMYLYSNSIIDFFVEADYNPDFRDTSNIPFYAKNGVNLSETFRSDRLKTPEEFTINRAYFDLYTTEVTSTQQRGDFDPNNIIPTTQPNAVIYSLPSFNLQNVDNWQYFLPANYFSFKDSDFGNLSAIHQIDQDRLIFLFSKSSPYISMGRDFLELEESGRKITIGDGGLFAQDPREIMPTDNNYGACTSKYAFSNTHLGRFFPSQIQGRILNYTESLDDISRQGIFYWCKKYMPIQLYEYFPDYPKIENPVAGVGYLTVFDPTYEVVYITKRDFIPRPEYVKGLTYTNDSFQFGGRSISIRDSRYFQDISWTLSYSPVDKGFVSFHDWHPDLTLQLEDHFITVKGKTAWKHNSTYESFCNFYGTDYPFEIEYVSTSGQQVHTLRSLEYLLEVYVYKNYGRDRFHVLNENFDAVVIHNTEQISPLLRLVYPSNNPEDSVLFPRVNSKDLVSFDVLFHKEENKYRINQFWDMTKDRGEFTRNEFHLYPTDPSGYKNVINPSAIDKNKPEEEWKKFRHYYNKIRLMKTVSGNKKFIFKIFNTKTQISPR